ncbi:MAG: MFS transporter [Pseudomonadota bacterium]
MAGERKTPTAETAASEAAAQPGPWTPFGERPFLVLWAATVISNVGTWMHDVGAGWLMTTLSPSPLMVALVQTATALPMFLFALPAGTLADLIDRRRMLLVVMALALVVALGFGLLVLAGGATPLALLIVTFAMGTMAAVAAPTWQAIVPQLVPRTKLQSAIALNSMGINISRAIGPAAAGLLIVHVGIAWPFLVNALSFVAVLLALVWWRPPPRPESALPAERFFAGLRSGFRYVRSSPPLRATLARAILFFVPASAAWALLPLIARTELGGDAQLYGLMLAAVGIGAVAGALVLPRLKSWLGGDRLLAAACLLVASVMAGFATVTATAIAVVVSAGLGLGWIAALSTLNVSAQTALPDWVRARGLAVFVTVFFGSMTFGSLVWGQVAAATSIPVALLASAVTMIVGVVLGRRYDVQRGAGLDLTPSSHWPAPVIATAPANDRGPVMVTIEYLVDEPDRPAFLEALGELAAERRRDGGFGWTAFEDTAEPRRVQESFMVESWEAHLRQHERVTEADRSLQERVNRFHRGDAPPLVRHLLAAAS